MEEQGRRNGGLYVVWVTLISSVFLRKFSISLSFYAKGWWVEEEVTYPVHL